VPNPSEILGVITSPRRIAVIGAGYVGIPTAVVLAHLGHDVSLAERDHVRRDALQEGRSPIMEEGLDELLLPTLQSGRLKVVEQATDAVVGAEIVFLCVATPQGVDGHSDLSFVDAVAADIAEVLEPRAIVVNKSTVPVGTAARVAGIIGRDDITVVSNPEFLREGFAVYDSFHPERIVVGAPTASAGHAVADLFAPLRAQVVMTDETTSELTKYAANAFLAVKLSFANTMSRLCDELGGNVDDLSLGMGLDSRIGKSFLRPGPGWGGSCLPKDTAALVAFAHDAAVDISIVEAAISSNHAQQAHLVDAVRETVGGDLSSATVSVWGLTFKAGTSDRRDSPALEIVALLKAAGADVRAFDPTVAAGSTDGDLQGILTTGSVVESARGSDVIVVLTEWPEFALVNFESLAHEVRQRHVIDARNLLSTRDVRAAGFTYRGLGRR
jgi:UDPglucose 6-dehydrogenase